MSKKHHQNSIIPKQAAETPNTSYQYVTKNAGLLNGWKLDGNNAFVMASIRFLQHEYECFSDWGKQEMKVFWNFIEKLHNYTWQNLLDGARKTGKSGFAPTKIKKSQYPGGNFKNSLGDDIELFELRVDQGKRVHGFRVDAVFYICWLDKNHRICA